MNKLISAVIYYW